MSGYSNSGAPEYSMAGQANMTTNNVASNNLGVVKEPTSFMDNVKNYYNKANDFLTIGEAPKSVEQILQQSNINPANATLEQLNMATNIAKNQAGTGIVSGLIRNAPKIALGGYVAKKTGVLDDFFDTPEEEPVDILDRNSDGSVRTGQDVYRENEAKYKVGDLYSAPISYTTPNTPYQSYANINPYQSYAKINPFAIPTIGTGNPFYRPSVQTAAQGGEIFPRRTGGIMPNEGIPGQDSVRAMLMPGEFVMTTDAVKGAGGIPNMYHMMSALERKGRMA
jgi:hypothetical protein